MKHNRKNSPQQRLINKYRKNQFQVFPFIFFTLPKPQTVIVKRKTKMSSSEQPLAVHLAQFFKTYPFGNSRLIFPGELSIALWSGFPTQTLLCYSSVALACERASSHSFVAHPQLNFKNLWKGDHSTSIIDHVTTTDHNIKWTILTFWHPEKLTIIVRLRRPCLFRGCS